MSIANTIRQKPAYLVLVFFVLLYTVIYAFPLLWMVLCSVKSLHELFQYPPRLFPTKFSPDNFKEAWAAARWPMYIRNTLFVGAVVATGRVIISGLAGFGFSKEFKGSGFAFMLVLGTMMIPGETTLISRYLIVDAFGWLDTLLPLIVPGLTAAFSIFLYRQHYKTLPSSLEDAAMVDGCVEYDYYFRIAFPLAKSVTVIVWLLALIDEWNSYLWPLIVTTKDYLRVVQVGLTFFTDDAGPLVNLIMAACTFITIPIIVIFMFFQKQLMSGFATSGIKG